MSAPWPVGPISPAYRIAGGQVETLTLPEHPEVFTIPEPVRDTAHDGELVSVCLVPGREHEHYSGFTLPLIVEIAARITPWATWYLAPAYFGSADESGCAWGWHDVALCRTDLRPPDAVSNALHEAWHLSEEYIDEGLLAALDARLATGPAWPGDYHPQPCERRARAFAHFGMAMVEGCRVTIGEHAPTEVRLFWHVFNGDFGKQMAAARLPRPPGLLRRARALIGSLV